VPAQLKQVVRRAMMRKPKDRYADISELKRALDRYLSNNISIGPNALLVAFLKQRGKMSEVEALSRLTKTEMDRAERVELKMNPPVRNGWPSWAWVSAVVVVAIAVAGWLQRSHWLPAFKGLLPK
jgi:hypothetical protein